MNEMRKMIVGILKVWKVFSNDRFQLLGKEPKPVGLVEYFIMISKCFSNLFYKFYA